MPSSVRFCSILGLIFSTHCISAHAESFFQTEIKLPEHDPPLSLGVVGAEELRGSLPLIERLIPEAVAAAETKLGTRLQEDFSFFFDVRPNAHNGLTTVVPTNRILIYTEPPEVGSSIGFGRDFLLETITHEVAHMITIQGHRGLFRVLSKIVGNVSRPIASWPPWIHEGTAVWTEGALGGRPQSGVIEFDLRRFAEFARRKNVPPLESSDLDGQFDPHARRVTPGIVRYHFGYLFMDELFKKVPPAEFIRQSALDLGLSFRKVFAHFGVSVDAELALATKRWAATPLPAAPERAALDESDALLGPFSAEVPSWIRIRAYHRDSRFERPVLVSIRADGQVVTRGWFRSFREPTQALHFPSRKTWVVLSEKFPLQNAFNVGREVALFNEELALRCVVGLGSARIREIAVQGDRMGWIESSKNGELVARRATLNFETCALGEPETLLASTEPFERLSGILLGTDSWVLSASRGRNSFEERVLRGTYPGPAASAAPTELALPGRILTRGMPMPGFCPTCFVALERSRDYFGPVLFADGMPLRRIALTTGAQDLASNGTKLFLRESFWEKDRIIEIKMSDFTEVAALSPEVAAPSPEVAELSPATPTPSPAPTPAPIPEGQGAAPRTYRPFATLFPHFWLPQILVGQKGNIQITGTTFFNDLTDSYSGDLLAGYDSTLRRPVGMLSLYRNQLHLGPFSRLRTHASYFPVAPLQQTQDRWSAAVGLDAPYEWGGVRGVVSPELYYWEARPSPGLSSYRYIVPGIYVSLRSTWGHRAFEDELALPRVPPSFFIENRTRYIVLPETRTNFVAHLPLFFKSVLQLQVEHGYTHRRNFPASYIEWGGENAFSTQGLTFLTRGFKQGLGVSPQVFRGNVEAAYTLARPASATRWNRLRLENIDQRLIMETITFEPYRAQLSRYRLGRDYWTTVGTALDFQGGFLHYVRFKLSPALYYGFGKFGEWRATLSVRSGLDL